jgi:hypothetical protein
MPAFSIVSGVAAGRTESFCGVAERRREAILSAARLRERRTALSGLMRALPSAMVAVGRNSSRAATAGATESCEAVNAAEIVSSERFFGCVPPNNDPIAARATSRESKYFNPFCFQNPKFFVPWPTSRQKRQNQALVRLCARFFGA